MVHHPYICPLGGPSFCLSNEKWSSDMPHGIAKGAVPVPRALAGSNGNVKSGTHSFFFLSGIEEVFDQNSCRECLCRLGGLDERSGGKREAS